MKKLNWFQRNVLCMNIDIRKEQYTTFKDRRQLAHDQQLILHHASGSAAPADLTAPLSYAQWNQGSMALWSQIESDLGGSSYSTGQAYEDTYGDEYVDDDEEDTPSD